MEPEQSCASCGFLARRPYSADRASTFDSMPSQSRANGGGWWTKQVGGLGYRTVPACCVGAFRLLEEIEAIEPDTLDWRDKPFTVGEPRTRTVTRTDADTPERNEAAKVVFNMPRPECPQWFPHTPGLSPQWHLEALQMQQLEQDRRVFEAGLVQMQMDADHRIGRVGIWIGRAAIILAVAEISTMNEDAFLWRFVVWVVSQIMRAFS